MSKHKDIIEATRKEFDIKKGYWEHECFNGSYVPEMIEFALDKKCKQVEQWMNTFYETSSADKQMKHYTCFKELKKILEVDN